MLNASEMLAVQAKLHAGCGCTHGCPLSFHRFISLLSSHAILGTFPRVVYFPSGRYTDVKVSLHP